MVYIRVLQMTRGRHWICGPYNTQEEAVTALFKASWRRNPQESELGFKNANGKLNAVVKEFEKLEEIDEWK